jgi:uncharacterized protein
MSQLVKFFLFTLGFSWLFWIPAAIWQPSETLFIPVILLGAFGPTFTGIFMTYKYGLPEERVEFWRRAWDPRRVPVLWWAVAVLFVPTTILVSVFIGRLMGISTPGLNEEILFNPLMLTGFFALQLLGGPLAEELGWRGYALDRLQGQYSALSASLILGVVWGCWHLPLFFIEGTSQADKGFPSLLFAIWFVDIVASSVIYTWIYNHTNKSILAAVILHLVGNACLDLLVINAESEMAMQGLYILTGVNLALVAAIVAIWGGKTLSGREN